MTSALEQLNHYLRSDDVDAFFFARGGYGAMRILDRIDYDAIAANPRPIVGFSDITALHQAIAVRCGVGSVPRTDAQSRLVRTASRPTSSSGSGRCSPARRR